MIRMHLDLVYRVPKEKENSFTPLGLCHLMSLYRIKNVKKCQEHLDQVTLAEYSTVQNSHIFLAHIQNKGWSEESTNTSG